MDQLIYNFSIKSLADFFKKNISSFKGETEDINHYLEDKDFRQFTKLTRVGNVEFKNSDELIVFACKYNGILSERSSKKKQFEIAKLVLKEDFKDGAIFVFHDESGKFRFSFIRRNWDGKADRKYSPWKRFTYFVTPEDTNKTFRQRIGNCTFKDLDSIQEAFSVEKLTKAFYNDLFKWYQWTLTSEVGITFPNDTATAEDDRVKLEEQMIRLITRLLFVWFIKQKHLVPDELFKTSKLSEILKDFDPNSISDGSFYNAILQNLFFATLNKAVTEREFAKLVDKRDIKTRYRYAEMFNISEKDVLDLFHAIPFLNGGLFECLDKEESTDGIRYHLDGFSRSDKKFPNGNFKHRAFIPNAVFFNEENGLIPLLERYNFTVEENVPNEVQVALDPELLGNVFENLLGAFNPETQESARKQSGSFYTPKEIVAYMVDESLIAFLNNVLQDLDEDLIRQLFEQEALPEFFANDHPLCEKISTELRSVKILDPACGSGAFPMGILNRMVDILEKLDAKNKESHYDLKLHLIQECIYGVDIQTIAAQISKLRFFISLIVEQDRDEKKENYGITPLPNLETKFVVANTLIGIKSKPAQLTIFDKEDIEKTKQELLKIRKDHFYAKSAYKKKELRDKDAELRDKLAKLLKESGEYAPEDAVQFAQWNPYDQNASSPFFDPEWMFGLSKENGGLNSAVGYFDVVIGNPPYVYTRDVNFGVDFKKYVNDNYFLKLSTPNNKIKSKSSQSGKINLFALFILNGKSLITEFGTLNFIVPNNLLRGTVFDAIRYDILSNNSILSIIDLGAGIFDKVTASTILFQIGNRVKNYETKIITDITSLIGKSYNLRKVNQDNFFKNTSYTFNIMLDDEQLRLSNKIKENKISFGHYCIDIIEGIVAHKHLIIPHKKDGTFELLEGKDIKRFKINNASNHIIWNVKEIHRKRPDYLWDEPKKIVMQRISGGSMPLVAAIDKNRRKTFASINNIVLKIEYKGYYEFFTALLNSKLINWFYANNFSNNSSLTVNISKTFLETLPVTMPEIDLVNSLCKILDDLEDIYDTNEYRILCSKVDNFIYQLYNLTYDEVKIIDPLFSLSKNEYDEIKI